MPIPRLPARRYPAGVDRRFDDLKDASDEFIRLARRGHVFGGWEAAAECGEQDLVPGKPYHYNYK